MEFLDGGEIQQRICDDENVSEDDIRYVFKLFIAALGRMHACGYIHNDLKVQNLMLESQLPLRENSIRIIDLGYMMHIPNGESSVVGERLRGTPGYIAPETLTEHLYSYKTV